MIFASEKKLIGNLREVQEIKTLLGVGFMLTFRIDKTIDDNYQAGLVYDFEIFNTDEDITIEEKNDNFELIDTRITEVEFEQD